MGYTFYGDLLGISGYYRLSPKRAYGRLNEFYNMSFSCLSEFCRSSDGVEVNMFSDSIFVWGENEKDILPHLQLLYLELIHAGLLLQGALVDKKLRFDPRLTLDNFGKHLPKDDTLARAVGLARSQKGARFLVENRLVERLLERHPDWMTPEGYALKIDRSTSQSDILRRISPTPDLTTYEVLYFWSPDEDSRSDRVEADSNSEFLKDISKMISDEFSIHYRETIRLRDRSNCRRETTNRLLGETV